MENTEKRRRRVRRWAALACATIFLLSCAMLFRERTRSAKEWEANRQLAQKVQQARTLTPLSPAGETSAESPSPYAPSGNLLAYDGLWQENHDLAGWLSIPGLDIDLPVMYTPRQPERYLRRSFDGSYALSGSLFLGEGWSPEGNWAIIYGHNMKDGSMFGELSRYESLEYALEHPVIRFDSLTEEREYTVLAAFYSQVYNSSQSGVFRYYQCAGLEDQAGFEAYLEQLRAEALYDTGADIQFGDRLLLLSTCSYHKQNGRFVVAACQKAATS